jgi:hypothetical protein
MFFSEDTEFTKHGYYQIDNIKTLSKFEAYQLSGKDWSKVKFIFNDEIYDQYDWTVEPEEDIYELYRQRAHQLREKYDYLVLMYSGGVDSHTVLETFLNNNIKLDEVCTFSTSDFTKKYDKLNQEVFNSAVPFINSLNLSKLGIIFRTIEIGQLIIDQWDDEFHFENFQFYANSAQWITVSRSYKFKSKIKDHMNLIEKGKTVCYIWGADKPSISIQENKYVFTVNDASVDFGTRQYVTRSIMKDNFSNFYDEAFYISRDAPKISIKQSHLLVKLMKTIPVNDARLRLKTELSSTGPFVVHHKQENTPIYLSKKTVDGTIYPKAILSNFGDDKLYNSSLILSPKDDWFSLSSHNNRWKFEQKIKNLVNENRSYFKYDHSAPDYRLFKKEEYKNIIPNHAVYFFSKYHVIGDIA